MGSTTLPPGGNVYKDEEISTTRFPSGGGFSNIYPAPAYQQAAVANYLTNHNPPYPYYTYGPGYGNGIYNRTGRGYPDVAAIGDNVVIFTGGLPTLIGGTSASAPVFASLLTRINDERLKAGKATVGFVNPTLVSFSISCATGFLAVECPHVVHDQSANMCALSHHLVQEPRCPPRYY